MSSCNVFNEVILSHLNNSVKLKLDPKSLQNVTKAEGTMTRVLDEIKLNSVSFKFNQILQTSDQSFKLKRYANRVILEDRSCQHVSIEPEVFSICSRLQLLSIGSSCLQASSSLSLIRMPVLKTVLIKSNCFISPKGSKSKVFRVSQCPQLISITIEPSCFNAISKIEVSRLYSLVSLKIGSNCFNECHSFSLSQCEMLEQLVFPEDSFQKLNDVEIRGD